MEGAGAALAAAVAAAGTASCRPHFSRETELGRWKSAGGKVVAAQCESEPQGPRAVSQSSETGGLLGREWLRGHPLQTWN